MGILIFVEYEQRKEPFIWSLNDRKKSNYVWSNETDKQVWETESNDHVWTTETKQVWEIKEMETQETDKRIWKI